MRKINNKKIALSLTEMLIVLTVIAILFAAMAPIITKRAKNDSYGSSYVWNYITFDDEYDSFFDPAVPEWTSSLYVNATPQNNDTASGKMVINASDISGHPQHHIQFRYGPDRPDSGNQKGINAGNLIVVKDNNVIFGPDTTSFSGSRNVAVGLDTLGSAANNTVAVGDKALMNANCSENEGIVALGALVGRNYSCNIDFENFVGAYSGGHQNYTMNVSAIGYNAFSNNTSRGVVDSVFIGSNSGNGFTSDSNNTANTFIGTSYSPVSTQGTTIIGYNVYKNGDPNVKNMTAIGYRACESVSIHDYDFNEKPNTGNRICLGVNSAYSPNNTPDSFHTDNNDHIFIGGNPSGAGNFSGRSVLEIHRKSDGTDATVIMNSNLVVRGNIYSSKSASEHDKFNVWGRISTSNASYKVCSEDNFYGGTTPILKFYNGYLCTDNSASTSISANALSPVSECQIGSGACPSLSSDIRLKTDISVNNDGLNKLEQIVPYNYTFKSDIAKLNQVGVIAQNLSKVFPNSIAVDNEGFLSIRWDEMFYSLINSIKELNMSIKNISNKISNMKSEIKILKASQKDCRKKISELNIRVKKLESK